MAKWGYIDKKGNYIWKPTSKTCVVLGRGKLSIPEPKLESEKSKLYSHAASDPQP